jgi:hypothetical protein
MGRAMMVVKGRLTAYAIAAPTAQIVANEPSELAQAYQALAASKPELRNSQTAQRLFW